MKKKIITALTAIMIIASSAVPTMANTVGYNFTFYSPQGYVSSNSGTKNDTEQRYWVNHFSYGFSPKCFRLSPSCRHP